MQTYVLCGGDKVNKKIKIYKVKEKRIDDNTVFFTGMILYHGKRLKFLFHPNPKRNKLTIYRWHEVEKADITKISNFLCETLKPGTTIKSVVIA